LDEAILQQDRLTKEVEKEHERAENAINKAEQANREKDEILILLENERNRRLSLKERLFGKKL
jgi:hypothetical protein